MSSSAENRRVLIIEDDYFLAMDVRRVLDEAGAITIGPCAEATSALELIEREQVDCALLDINLGNGPTFEVARALKARGIPFAFVTGYSSLAIPEEFAQAERLEKPYGDAALTALVAKLA